MRWRMIAAAVAPFMLAAGPGGAAVTTYTTQASFALAAGSTTLVTFNDFATEVSFRTSALDVGPFSLLGFGSDQGGRNFIDRPPLGFSEFDVDGTTVVSAIVRTTDGGVGFTITFHAPILAFGASFGGLQNSMIRTLIELAGTTVTPPEQPVDMVQFFGVVSDTPFTTLRFIAAPERNDGFGMDNVLFAAAPTVETPVPAPGASALALGALGMLAAVARRRPKPA